jgi:hypothetical protein
MIAKLWRALALITNRNRIPKLPRGMLATAYKEIARPEGRVLARLGARDPTGVKLAMRRYKAATIDELVAQLKHYEVRRNIGRRLRIAVGRVVGGSETDPHRADILRAARHDARSAARIELEQRLKRARKAFSKDEL